MSGDREPFYWMSNPEWYKEGQDGGFELTEKAPERARRSFAIWKVPRSEKKCPYDIQSIIDEA